MNVANAPLSPVSIGGGSEWSGAKYNDGPYPSNNRGPISPPNSGGSIGNMNGFPSGPKSIGGPSPPPSIGRLSNGSYARRDSTRTFREDNYEALERHYFTLKNYLAQPTQDGRSKPPPNKARDKLLRLSPVQFLELSTDVYDELRRRQSWSEFKRRRDDGRLPPNAPEPPRALLNRDNFHKKRNDAREKLSSLGDDRFRDLATDVFFELERRNPQFLGGGIPRMGSPASMRGPPSRTGTPVNSMGPRGPGPNRMRRPSDASSIRSAAPPRINGDYPVPPSPGLPNASFLQQKQFQSNTIVPTKSTMVEEDDGDNDDDNDAFGLEKVASDRESKRSGSSQGDKKIIDDYQSQVRDLQEKLDTLENQMKKKDDEMNNILEGERSRSTAANLEKKGFDDMKSGLESKLTDAQNLNESLQEEMERMRNEHDLETRRLREQVEEARETSRAANRVSSNPELQRENEDLRAALQEQQQVTEEVRRDAEQFLREMRDLSQAYGPAWDKQSELEKTVDQLQNEVREWRNRYARSKTQLRNLRASSVGLGVEQDASRFVRDKGFIQGDGMVKDVHVTKFQISIDELLRIARTEDPEQVIEAMKAAVVSVRRIIKDLDESSPKDEQTAAIQQKMKARVSATANNLITASKNFASAAGMSPVSLLDAASSHVVAAIVELLRVVKIRTTPDGELEADDDDQSTPVGSMSTGFFSNRSTQETSLPSSGPSRQANGVYDTQSPLAPPPPFQGLGGHRDSSASSAYSPAPSPRQSNDQFSRGSVSRSINGSTNGMNGVNGMNGGPYSGAIKGLSSNMGSYAPPQVDARIEELDAYLQDQSEVLVQTIQGLVGSIRSDAPIAEVTGQIGSIADIVGKIVSETEVAGLEPELTDRLDSCRQRILEAGDHGQDLADRGLGSGDREWRMWTQTLPPIAFEIARETKELCGTVKRMVGGGADDFS